jgi:hypothetical protein
VNARGGGLFARGGRNRAGRRQRAPSPLQRLAVAAELLSARRTGDRLSSMRWLPPQDALLRYTGRRGLLRCGNQSYGKTTAGLAEVLLRCLGRHPYKTTTPPPLEAWVLCASWQQSVAIQAKLWDLVPKADVSERTKFDPINGFGSHSPALVLRNGSIIRIKTTQQGALNLAGATIDIALFDEPPYSVRVWTEIVKRVQARNGTVLLTLTPINRPVGWLRELVEAGHVDDMHFPLKAEYLVPVGQQEPLRLADGTVCDQVWIDKVRAETPTYEEPVVVDGEWETRVVGRIFDCFTEAEHVKVASPAPRGAQAKLGTGLDHGSRPGRQAGVLVAVHEVPGEYPTVAVWDETPEATRPTVPEDDAEDLLAMLKRSDLEWGDLDHVFGDRPAGIKGEAGRKGNLDIEDALRRKLKLSDRRKLKPRILDAKRGRGANQWSVDPGIRWIYHQLVRGKFWVHPRCVRIIKALNEWDGREDDPNKDVLDALRYALRPWIIGGGARTRNVAVRYHGAGR